MSLPDVCTALKMLDLDQEQHLEAFVQSMMKPLDYHNFPHALDVRSQATLLARLKGIPMHFTHLIRTAALLHDAYYVVGAPDNEDHSANLAEEILPQLHYTPAEIQFVKQLIKANRNSVKPASVFEEILYDADRDNLGREDFLLKNELLRIEQGVQDKQLWYKRSLQFLEQHKYYTPEAQRLRQAGLEMNKMLLSQLIQGGGL